MAGIRGSGKTVLARYIASLHPKEVLVYDPLDEWPEYDVLQPRKLQYPSAAEEFAVMIQKAKLFDPSKHNYRLLVVDEAVRIVPAQRTLHPVIARLNAEHRHIPLAIVWIAQRPRMIHTSVVDLADHLMIFRLPGGADHRFLEDTSRGLGTEIAALKKYHFVYVDQDRQFWTCAPAAAPT